MGRPAVDDAETRVMEAFTGEIRLFAGGYAPRGWAFCDGRLLPVSRYQELFTVLGAHDNGGGQFYLPDLRGRLPLGVGRGTDLPEHRLGDVGNVAAAADGGVGFLALHFIICLHGVFPEPG